MTALQNSVGELRRCLLPREFLIPGTYDDESVIKLRSLSFRVLAHAEIEAFLEDRAIEVAKAALKAWEQKQHLSRSTICLLGFSGHQMDEPPATLIAPGQNQVKSWPERVDITFRLKSSITKYVQFAMKENHGVKEKNLMLLLMPIGFDPNELDTLFLTTMDDFGQKRGEVAHSSNLGQVQQGVDPREEFESVLGIVNELEKLDDRFDILLLAAAG
jgi:hypothetical protein